MKATDVLKVLNRLARVNSGLPKEDREALFTAYIFCYQKVDELDIKIKRKEEIYRQHGQKNSSGPS